MQFKNISDNLRAILGYAQREAAQRHGNYLDVEHLMLGLLRQPAGIAHDLFQAHAIDSNALYEQIAASVGMERPIPAPVKDYTKWAKDVMQRTEQEAEALGHLTFNSGHLLLGLMGETDGAVHETLAALPLTLDEVRDYLHDHSETASNPPPKAAAAQAAPRQEPGQIVLVPFRPASARARKKAASPPSRWGNMPWIIAGLALLVVYMAFVLPGNSLFTFVIVLIGWVFSVTLHEFSHALVAYMGGDYTVKNKGYLSFNPLKYTHPMLSIGMPLLFLALGGIGLPGGAVYIEKHRLRGKWWSAAVSAAGPASNLLLALILAMPFLVGLVDTDILLTNIAIDDFLDANPSMNEDALRANLGIDTSGSIWENATLWSAVAFLAMLQVTAVFFNLLPVPPLDGFGIIEPFLDERTRFQLRQFGMYGIFLVFLILWFVEPVAQEFWDMVFSTTDALHIPGDLVSEGFDNFMFWRNPPQ